MTADRWYYGVSLSFETISKAQTVYKKWQSNVFQNKLDWKLGSRRRRKMFFCFYRSLSLTLREWMVRLPWKNDLKNLPYIVYLSPVETPPQSNDGYFMFVQFGVTQAPTFGCTCPKRKCVLYIQCRGQIFSSI